MVCENPEQISLLGGSQTFFGVLTTVVVLCLFSTNSNFIFNLLEEIIIRIKSYISSLGQKDTKETITTSSDYKLLLIFLNNKENLVANTDLYNKGLEKMTELTQGIIELQYEFIKTEPEFNRVIDLVKNSKEQFLAPFYTFLFCITVFAFDEILRSSHIGFDDFMVSALSLFTLLSYVFWILIWAHFFKRSSLKFKVEKSSPPTTPNNNKIILSKFFFRLLICVISLIVAILSIVTLSGHYTICKSILIVALIVPASILGYRKIKTHIKFSEYTYQFILGHFVALILISALLSVIVLVAVKLIPVVSVMISSYYDCALLKISILLFVLLNGLVFPFLMPYVKYNLYEHKARSYAKSSNEKANALIKHLMIGLSEYAATIPTPTAEY